MRETPQPSPSVIEGDNRYYYGDDYDHTIAISTWPQRLVGQMAAATDFINNPLWLPTNPRPPHAVKVERSFPKNYHYNRCVYFSVLPSCVCDCVIN